MLRIFRKDPNRKESHSGLKNTSFVSSGRSVGCFPGLLCNQESLRFVLCISGGEIIFANLMAEERGEIFLMSAQQNFVFKL